MTAVSLLRGTLAIGILALLGLAVTGPWALSQFPLFLAGLSAAFGQICHQETSRALFIEGLPSLLCARCSGAFAGGSVAFLLPTRLPRNWVLGFLAAGAAAWLLEAGLGLWPAEARLLAGSAIGLALAAPLAEASKPQILC
jgi:hypothetical protein